MKDLSSQKDAGSIARRFVMPPFTLLDTRSGPWQERRRAWLEMGVHENLGREENLLSDNLEMNALKSFHGSGTSMFDPVLTECLVEWFCPQRGHVLDPFAGGSVRGLISTFLGRAYTGIDLRAAQVMANEAQRKKVLPASASMLQWVCADSDVALDILQPDLTADMILTCPPYADLEVYSNDVADLSVIAKKDHGAFLMKYQSILAKSARMLSQDRFFIIVVGEYRDKRGVYRNFVGETVAALQSCGLDYYNEAILMQPAGTLPLRVGGYMTSSRKLGRCHQNVLVFVKGDPKAATQACLKDAPAELGYKGLPIVSKPKRGNTRRDIGVGVTVELKDEAPVGDGGMGVEDRSAVLTEARELGGEGNGSGPVTGDHEGSQSG